MESSLPLTGTADMNARQRSRLMNMNRGLIFALTLGGMILDGPRISDLLCTLALFVWLWLPLCTRLEAQLLHWVDGHRLYGRQGSGKSARTSPSM
jgi:hypothetical protein